MRAFSFFSRVTGDPCAIRGYQMAVVLGGRVNPEQDYADDTCIYLLGSTPAEEPAHAYYDVLDCGLARIARVARKTGPVIAASLLQQDTLERRMPGREVIYLPQHHCNFANEQRPDRPVRTVGVIGGWSAVQCNEYQLACALNETGLRWVHESHYHHREQVVRFYRGLDVQVCYRPEHVRGLQGHMNCLKLVNAGSFGIPTVAYPEPAYVKEWGDACLWGETPEAIVAQVRRLQSDSGLYGEMAARARTKAASYHLDVIAQRYRGLA